MQVHLPFPLHPALASMYGSHFMEKYDADDTLDHDTWSNDTLDHDTNDTLDHDTDETLDHDTNDTIDHDADDTHGHGADYSLEILVMVISKTYQSKLYLIYTDLKNNVKFQTRLDLGCVPFWNRLLQVEFYIANVSCKILFKKEHTLVLQEI